LILVKRAKFFDAALTNIVEGARSEMSGIGVRRAAPAVTAAARDNTIAHFLRLRMNPPEAGHGRR
jgi:hypothetical protein